MASIRFYIRKEKEDKEGLMPIYLETQAKGDKTRRFTGYKVRSRDWDKSRQRLKPEALDSDLVNRRLDRRESEFREMQATARVLQVPVNMAYVRTSFLKDILPGGDDSEKAKADITIPTFFERYNQFVDASKIDKQPTTIAVYRNLQLHLQRFGQKTGYHIAFKTINQNFYDGFNRYLISDQGMQNYTVGKQFKTLKTFMHFGLKRGWHSSDAFKEFKVIRENTEMHPLSQEEVAKISALNLSNRKPLMHALDVFLFQCFTGLRYSDVQAFMPVHIHDGFIRLYMKKTQKPVEVPINIHAEAIIEKYRGMFTNCLPVISNSKANMYLKEIARMAGLNTEINVTRYSGARRIDRVLKKWELVTTHTGRHTFATLSLEKGMPVHVLKEILGHSKIQTTMKYVTVTSEVKKREMLNVWK